MKKINFKQGKYILPLIMFPIFFLFFYVYSEFTKDKNQVEVVVTKDVNADIAEASKDVQNKSISNKIDEYRKNFRDADGYTHISSLDQEVSQNAQYDDLYSSDEKRLLDSIEQARKNNALSRSNDFQHAAGFRPRSENISESDRQLLELLNPSNRNHQQELAGQEQAEDPVDLMKKQFSMIDSFQKANDPDYQKQLALEEQQELQRQQQARIEASRFTVQKAANTKTIFNTVKRDDDHKSFINAIIDEDITGWAGSRIRLKLMEDILVGQELVKKGTYLYATVNGFSQQRVTLVISSIMKGNQILPINLEIYDVDGMPGLYVPASAFREFTKELGGNSMQGMNMSSMNQDQQNQFLTSILQRAFTSTSQAVSKAIRKNKAKLKYATHIYLIDPKQTQNK
ncbi:MAG TPA: conjugative transposon protein TraM [Sphingobacterium sp.]|nr:conjugative transposon protein TraM [Sphingobacterium sp.]